MINLNSIFKTISNYSSLIPDKVAVIYKDRYLTFAELEEKSDQLAGYLRERYHHQKAGKIALYIEPSLDLPIAILGIMKAGHSYVPLSSFQPVQRIAQIIDDSQSFLVLTNKTSYQKSKLQLNQSIVLEMDDIDWSAQAVNTEYPELDGSQLAYTLYTSGSTGRPKGVEVEHRHLAYYIDWFNTHVWSQTQAQLPLTSSLSFAAAVTQLFSPLARGDTLHILPEGSLNNPKFLFEWFASHSNTAIYCVPTLWKELLNYKHLIDPTVSFPDTVFLSGEAVAEDLKQRTFADIDNIRVFNLYGPTETVANCAFIELQPESPITIGKAMSGSEFILLDDNGMQVEGGAIGEICIAGPGVARGYANLPELSEDRFFTHRGLSAHKTGDLGQFDAEGNMVYLGRKDRQVKLCGVRIELGDIEACLRRHCSVQDAVVKMVDEELIAYLVTSAKPTAWDLRAYLSDYFSPVMTPAQFVYLDSFPKLPNGKLDNARLPKPASSRPDLKCDYRAPSNDLEQDLVDIWQEVLGLKGLGVDDDFFALGGNSLQAMRARNMIRRRLYSDLDFDLVMRNATPSQLAAIIPYYLTDGTESDSISQPKAEESQDTFSVLSPSQAYFVTLEQTSANPVAYQPAFSVFLEGQVNEDAILWSINKVLDNNPVLRSRFNLDDFTAKQGGYTLEQFNIQHHKLANLDKPLVDYFQQEWLAMADMSVIDIDTTPAINVTLLSHQDSQYVVLVRVHHAVFDHESIALFFNQFKQAYQAYSVGDLSFSSKSVHNLNLAHHKGAVVEQESQIHFWLSTLQRYLHQGADASLHAVKDYPTPDGYQIELSDIFTQQIKAFARKHNTTTYVLLLTLFNLTLSRETRYKNVTIGLPTSSRSLLQNDDQIGCFVNMVTYFQPVSDADNRLALLQSSSKTVYSLLDNQSVSYQLLVDEMRRHAWLDKLRFPITFNYLSAMPTTQNVAQCQMTVQHIVEPSARCDLALTVDDGERLRLSFDFETSAFTKQQIMLFAEQYLAMISETLSL
ncbi:amino acid adenylation domain-containing protein [Vibrio sp. OCN044]|uniref:Amino acid adenylation domain-containing protein n=1 Tax=Vibrio tetraodonis subsp. pristinus TaxID=2695891 RepID=A0A6L8LTM1_9VIBR|nr:non-ribosomal peptide synthetase [Vibrio tetraodonis]MYM59065.1 amino acid adenylation domain-containing protein [Vibrio tetraodonis subsp. pristinus]